MTDTSTRSGIPLTPPIVSIAYAEDGLLKTTDLETPVPVQVMVWPAAEPGYYFQLTLDDEWVGDKRTITAADNAYDMITVHLSEHLLIENGTYQLGYVAVSPITGASMPSPRVSLKVDRTPPGAALLAPLIFPNASFGDRLTGLLPGYAGMEQGDVIQTLCNGVPGPAHTVQADELSLRPIEIDFERELMQSLAAQTACIEYLITDRAGNQSVMSLPVMLSMKL